eukprot:TRINITY_DN5397_c0_g1_i1.p1 TRINITY_DN5397_c0_g1~~TRINITY_DN5397_c0_g1_i1.p1  ORF type:complete len:233 (+),score=42.95 TRINITY_DN5397_c0_g1_i1:51-701(+)
MSDTVVSTTINIDALLNSADRYEDKSIPVFEEYILNQIKNKQFNMEASLALVKLYQFYPNNINIEVLEMLLAQCLLYLKEQAFNLALYMIPDNMQSSGNIAKLCLLSDALETAHFSNFWAKVDDVKPIIDKIPDFENSIRSFIAEIVMRVYRTINKDYFGELLGLKDDELLSFIENTKWKIDGDNVTFPLGSQPVTKKVKESVQFEQLIKILQTLK